MIVPQLYEQVAMGDTRALIVKSMSALNESAPHKALNLVLFDDALRHLLRIARIIGSPRGHAILLGMSCGDVID